MSHAFFVAAAYGISALAIIGLIGWVLADKAARMRELAALEARGIRRRSAGAKPPAGAPT